MKRTLTDTELVLQVARPTIGIFFLLLILVRYNVRAEILAAVGLVLLILGIWTIARFMRQVWHSIRGRMN